MNLDLFLIQAIFEEFAFSQNYFTLAQLDDENPSMTRNPNPTWIQDNNESISTTSNPSLTRIQDVARNPNPKIIQDVTSNPYPKRIEDPFDYNRSPIAWACAKKMKEALKMLIQAIQAESINLNQSDPFWSMWSYFYSKAY